MMEKSFFDIFVYLGINLMTYWVKEIKAIITNEDKVLMEA
jgi:hypothetical protein